MKTIRVVLDDELLGAADRAARRMKTNRSALFREALRAHLRALEIRDRERRDREGYARYRDSVDGPAGLPCARLRPRVRRVRSAATL